MKQAGPLNVLVIGAGRIAAFADTPDASVVLSHAHAITRNPRLNLLGFVDPDQVKAGQATGLWGGKAYVSLQEALQENNCHIVSLTAPDELHYPILKELANYPIRLVFAEKPLTHTVGEASEILTLYEKRAITLAVNYSRRFIPAFQDLARQIQKGEFGKLLCGNAYYGKGLLHNGTHMLDWLRLLLGEIRIGQKISELADFNLEDPTVSAILKAGPGASVSLLGVDSRICTVFELELLFEQARLKLGEFGGLIEVQPIGESPDFKGYRQFQSAQSRKTELTKAMALAYHNLADHTLDEKPLLCDGRDAFEALSLAWELLEEKAYA